MNENEREEAIVGAMLGARDRGDDGRRWEDPAPGEDGATGGRAGVTAHEVDPQGLPQPGRHAHARESLDVEMLSVKDSVLRMGAIVENQILRALDALATHDAELAEAVIADDARVNEVQRAVAALVAMTIATQAPVARDLRFLLALDRVTYELERIGDHAGSVAKQARKLVTYGGTNGYAELQEMALLAARQVRDVVMALVDIDESRAREVAERDDDVDRLYHATFTDVLAEMRADPANVEPGTRMLFAAHYLERIGDRVTNIAEDVVFLSTGEVEDLNH